MVLSMTAFANRKFSLPQGDLRWDIKSVNQRYFEASIKLPDVFQELEYQLRDILRQKIHRGKIFCQLHYEDNSIYQGQLELNTKLLDSVIENLELLAKRLKNPAAISPIDLLKWPEVIKGPKDDFAVISQALIEEFFKVIEDFLQARSKEGLAIQAVIEQRLQTIDDILLKIRKRFPSILNAYRNRILDKVLEMKAEIDSNRLEQEMLLMAQKMDVSEELDRLLIHVSAMKTLLKTGGMIGRHLDFLSQELNREANTLASKSIDAQLTQEAVELKVLIEQIREQVQNIE